MNAIYDTRAVDEILRDKAFADNTPAPRYTPNDFTGMAGLAILFLDVLFSPKQASVEFIVATRADKLRTMIQQGKRLRLEQMQDILQVHREKDKSDTWHYITVERVAELTELPLSVVQKAVKRFWFF